MRPTFGVFGALALFGLGCGGFMEDQTLSGPAAVERIGALTGGPLPQSASEARSVDTTGIDWLMNGEVRMSRADADPWFKALSLGCDQPTVEQPGAAPIPRPILGHPSGWQAPFDADWRTRTCDGSTHSGPHYRVWITDSGDPAWVAIQVMTM